MTFHLPPIAGNIDSIEVNYGLRGDRIQENGALIVDPGILARLDKKILSIFTTIIPTEAGEKGKSVELFRTILAQHREAMMNAAHITAIGGGSTMNMVTSLVHKLAASGYKNPFHLIPTTLMSMVDVAYGSLGRLNSNGQKNKIRCAYDPTSIILDPIFLRNLPAVEIKRGLAECLTHALLQATPTVEECLNLLRAENPSTEIVFNLVPRILRAKAAVIKAMNDGNKILENLFSYGHVDAEPREEASGFRLAHGDAVLLGIAVELDLCGPPGASQRIAEVIPRTPLGAMLPSIDFDAEVMKEAYRTSGKERFRLGNDRYRIICLASLGQFVDVDKETKIDFAEFDFETIFETARKIIKRAVS